MLRRPGCVRVPSGAFVRILALLAVASLGLAPITAATAAPAQPHSAPGGGGTQAASTGPVTGYWMAAADGSVYSFHEQAYGSLRGVQLAAPIVAVVSTPDGRGFWQVAADGGVFRFGDAGFFGSAGAYRLTRPIVGMAPTSDGRGYWLVASDGGVFSFGDAAFRGSTGNVRLSRPVVGMAATHSGGGYWLVASDGGIFSFGDAVFQGSTGNVRLSRPVVGMAATHSGGGYWLVASDGGIFSFGDAVFQGSTGNVRLNRPVVGMAADPSGPGYWLVASDGGIFTFGGAPYRGSTGASPGRSAIVGMAATLTGTDYPGGAIYPPGTTGTDISWPQCGGSYPPSGSPVSIVGINDGISNRINPCFVSEANWAGPNITVYLNTDRVQPNSPQATGGPKACASGDNVCLGYNWGFTNALADVRYVHANGFVPAIWWLDVEAPCGSGFPLWQCSTDNGGLQSNAAVIQGAVDALQGDGLTAGIYSTYYQWPRITGGTTFPGLPIWIATVPSSTSQWAADCNDSSLRFAGGTPYLVQWLGGSNPPTAPYDGDYACNP